MLDSRIAEITDRIAGRSRGSRNDYLDKIGRARQQGVSRSRLSCGNIAHAYAASEPGDKSVLAVDHSANLAIVSSYNYTVEMEERVAERFNIAVRGYKERKAASGG